MQPCVVSSVGALLEGTPQVLAESFTGTSIPMMNKSGVSQNTNTDFSASHQALDLNCLINVMIKLFHTAIAVRSICSRLNISSRRRALLFTRHRAR